MAENEGPQKNPFGSSIPIVPQPRSRQQKSKSRPYLPVPPLPGMPQPSEQTQGEGNTEAASVVPRNAYLRSVGRISSGLPADSEPFGYDPRQRVSANQAGCKNVYLASVKQLLRSLVSAVRSNLAAKTSQASSAGTPDYEDIDGAWDMLNNLYPPAQQNNDNGDGNGS